MIRRAKPKVENIRRECRFFVIVACSTKWYIMSVCDRLVRVFPYYTSILILYIYNQFSVERFLKEHVDPNEANDDGLTALHQVSPRHVHMYQEIISEK